MSATNTQVFVLPTAALAYSAVRVFSFLSAHSFSSLIGKNNSWTSVSLAVEIEYMVQI